MSTEVLLITGVHEDINPSLLCPKGLVVRPEIAFEWSDVVDVSIGLPPCGKKKKKGVPQNSMIVIGGQDLEKTRIRFFLHDLGAASG